MRSLSHEANEGGLIAQMACSVASNLGLRLDVDADRKKAVSLARKLWMETDQARADEIERTRREGLSEALNTPDAGTKAVSAIAQRLTDWALAFEGSDLVKLPQSKSIKPTTSFSEVLKLLFPKIKGPKSRLSRFKSWWTSHQTHLHGKHPATKAFDSAVALLEKRNLTFYECLDLARSVGPWLAARKKLKKFGSRLT